MGYYTDYLIDMDAPIAEGFEVVFDNVTDYSGCLSRTGASFFMNAKWYEYEKDMRKISEQFPDVIFTVSGEGEENDDIWRAYFKNGKSQYCEAIINFEPYDEGKMK